MKLRANQIVVGVLVVIAVVIGGIFWSAWSPGKVQTSGSPDEDFLRSVREEAQESSGAETEVGEEPPGGTDPSRVPAIKVVDHFDVGTVPNDRLTTKTVMIGNSGTFDLVIRQISTQCPCTVGKVKTKVIPPGGEVPMTITVDPRRIPGFESEKYLTIFSNDRKNEQASVKVSVKVEPEFSVEPATVDLGKVARGRSVTAQIVFRQLQDAPFAALPFEIKNVKVSELNPAVKAVLIARPEAEWAVPGHREYAVDITFDSGAAPVGPFDAVVSVDTTCARLFNHRVFVHGEVVAADVAAPMENPA